LPKDFRQAPNISFRLCAAETGIMMLVSDIENKLAVVFLDF